MDLLGHCQAENERLRKLVEPQEWLGWEQVDSIYDEARLLRKERDEARQQLEGAVEALERIAAIVVDEPSPLATPSRERLRNAVAIAVHALRTLGRGQ